MKDSRNLKLLKASAEQYAKDSKNNLVTIEHTIVALCNEDMFQRACKEAGIDSNKLRNDAEEKVNSMQKMSEISLKRIEESGREVKLRMEYPLAIIAQEAVRMAEDTWVTGEVEVSHYVAALMKPINAAEGASNPLCKVTASQFNAVFNSIMNSEAEEYGMKAEPMKELAGGSAKLEGDWAQFVTDLVEQARSYDKPFIGRQDVIERTMQVLCKAEKANPVHVGEPGVGKSAVTLGLAKMIANDEVPEVLKGSKLYAIDIAGMLAGAQYRGDFEGRLKDTLNGLSNMDNVIVFIDEIHTIIGTGANSESTMDAGNIIKPYLTSGKLKFIGATTNDEFRRYIEKDKALMRRFQRIDISEPSIEDATKIVGGLKKFYEDYHHLQITDEAVKSSVELSARYINDRFLPDKAIDLLDETCAYFNVHPENGSVVKGSNIEDTLSKICRIPKKAMASDDFEKIRDMDKKLKNKVFGQDEAADTLTECIQLSKAGLNDENKPIGSFLFVGPSGVGKTEISKQLAATMGIDFVRFDMSEYMEEHSAAKLIGSPAGYVGYEDGGILVESVRKHPHAVFLFDEIEKAHPNVYKIFLQMLDYGSLSDNKGRKGDFRNTIIIMTSNAGSTDVKKSMGFSGDIAGQVSDKVDSMKAVDRLLPPELRGRITKTIVFNYLNADVAKLIVKKELTSLTDKLKRKGITVTYSDAAIEQLVKVGVSASYGAREVQKAIDTNVKRLFVKMIIAEKAVANCVLDYENNEFVVKPVKPDNTPKKKKATVTVV